MQIDNNFLFQMLSWEKWIIAPYSHCTFISTCLPKLTKDMQNLSQTTFGSVKEKICYSSAKNLALSFLYAFELHLAKNSTVLWWCIALVSFCTGPNSANWQHSGIFHVSFANNKQQIIGNIKYLLVFIEIKMLLEI